MVVKYTKQSTACKMQNINGQLSFICPTCGVDLAELVEELAIQGGELDRRGRVPSEVAQHLQVQCAQFSDKSKEVKSMKK